MTTTTTTRTHVGLSATSVALLVGGVGVLGGGLGVVLDPALGWAVEQPWLPAHEVLVALRGVTAGATWWVQAAAGLALGVLAGLLLVREATVVDVADDEIVVLEGSRRRRLARSQVGATVVDRGRLSVRDHADADLVDVKVDCEPADLRRALVAHSWAVHD